MPVERTAAGETNPLRERDALFLTAESRLDVALCRPHDAESIERGGAKLERAELLGHRQSLLGVARRALLVGEREPERVQDEHLCLRLRRRQRLDERSGSPEVRKCPRRIALIIGELAEKELGLGGARGVAGRRELDERPLDGCTGVLVGSRLEHGFRVPQQKLRSSRVPLGRQIERRAVEPSRDGVGAELEGAVARLAQCSHGPSGELVGRLPRGAGELERAEIVVGEHLGVVLPAAESLDPLGGEAVLVSPHGARDLAVGDVADEHMVKRVLGLTFHGRMPSPAHELLSLERAKQLLDCCGRVLPDRSERVDPEHLTDDGGVLDEILLRLGKSVEAGGDQPVQGLRRGQLGARLPLDHQAGVLLGVEWIAFGPGDELPLRPRGQSLALQ